MQKIVILLEFAAVIDCHKKKLTMIKSKMLLVNYFLNRSSPKPTGLENSTIQGSMQKNYLIMFAFAAVIVCHRKYPC